VTAKRWRCATDPTYLATLSAASRATLVAQGGPLDRAAATRFEAHPFFDDAVRLRGWDEAAKDPAIPFASLNEHRALLEALASSRG
jgi:predicted HD phosphohydrolase